MDLSRPAHLMVLMPMFSEDSIILILGITLVDLG
jgi:hypothetical protein